MPVVNGTITLPEGAAARATVEITLVASTTAERAGFNPTGDVEIIGQVTPAVSATGTWTATLTANALITPAGTVYKVVRRVPTSRTPYIDYISVPNTAGPFRLEDLIVDPPAALPSAPLSDHLTDTIAAHAASAVSYAGGTGLVATTVEAALDELANEKLDITTASGTYVAKTMGGRVHSACSVDGGQSQTSLIEAEANALSAAGGGILMIPEGTPLLDGAATLDIPDGVTLEGAGAAYRNAPAGILGTTFLYPGSGTAMKLTRVTNATLRDFTIKATNPSGAAMRGLHLAGAWYADVQRVAVVGMTEAHGYALLSDVDTDFGSYLNRFVLLDAYGGVVRFDGNGAAEMVTTSTIDTCWAARFEADDAIVTWENCTPENWSDTYTASGKGGFTFDGFGHHVLLHANMEHGAGDFTAIVVKPTFTGKGVEEYGTAWQGFAGDTRARGTLGPYIKNNSVDRFEWHNLVAADRKRVREMGQQEPNGSYELVTEDVIFDAVGGGAQTARRMLARKILGTLKDYWDDGLKWALRNTKTLQADGSVVTFFTIPSNTGGGVNGFTVRVVAAGTHVGNGQIGSVREFVVAPGSAPVALAAQVNSGVNTLTIGCAQSGANTIVTASLAAVGSPSAVTLMAEVLGVTQSGVTVN